MKTDVLAIPLSLLIALIVLCLVVFGTADPFTLWHHLAVWLHAHGLSQQIVKNQQGR